MRRRFGRLPVSGRACDETPNSKFSKRRAPVLMITCAFVHEAIIVLHQIF
jgi:hypothetical protein